MTVPTMAQEIDAVDHRGLPPYAVYVARTIFMHTLAFNDPLKGISSDELRLRMEVPARLKIAATAVPWRRRPTRSPPRDFSRRL